MIKQNLSNENEQWKTIEGFENYLVSDQGRVMNAKTGKILKAGRNQYGYYLVVLCKDGVKKTKLVSRLVAEAFIPNPEGLETVNHINKVKTDNRVENLEWMTQGDNVRYSRAKPVEQYDLYDGRLIATYQSLTDCCELTGYCQSAISKACNGQYKRAYGYTWRYTTNTNEEYVTDGFINDDYDE